MKPLTQATDNQLVHAFQNGNNKALEILISRYKDKMFSTIVFMVKDKYLAEDIFQEVFIKVIDTVRNDRYTEEGKFLPWVMRIAHNLVIDYFRKNKKMPMLRETEEFSIFSILTDDSLNVENEMISSQVANDLNKIVEELPNDQREVLKMRLYQDLSFKEISELTGVSINTALGRMRYAIMNLRKIVEKNNIILTS